MYLEESIEVIVDPRDKKNSEGLTIAPSAGEENPHVLLVCVALNISKASSPMSQHTS